MTISTLQTLTLGGGAVKTVAQGWRLSLPQVQSGYADAQLDDYRTLPRSAFPWRPPVSLNLRARANLNAPLGTLGFGFWNDPFSLSLGQGGAARRIPAAPQAAWFFYGSPPNDMALAEGVPGYGWKASVLRSSRIPSLLLLPGAAAAVALGQLPLIRGPLMRLARRFVSAREKLLEADLAAWHDYRLEWKHDGVKFWVDGTLEFAAGLVPHPPLGLVIWIDNQYLIASPEGGFHFGTLKMEAEQWLEIEDLEVETP